MQWDIKPLYKAAIQQVLVCVRGANMDSANMYTLMCNAILV